MNLVLENSTPFRRVASIWVIATLSTLIAMLVGICFLAGITLPMSLATFLMPALLIQALFYAFELTAPVTLVLLPVAAIAFGRRTTAAMVALPIIGLAGGGLSIWAWHVLTSGSLPSGLGFKIFLVAGSLAGLAAGGFFGRSLYEIDR